MIQGSVAEKMDHSGPELLDILACGDPPAFATDDHHRVTFWNRGAERLLKRKAEEVLGRTCHDIVGARDVFGNRFCSELCPLVATMRKGDPLNACELAIPTSAGEMAASLTTLSIPGSRPDLFTLVHILQPLDGSSRLARALERLGATPVTPGAPPEPSAPPVRAPLPPPLTARETEILRWVAAGLQNKEIAQQLGISLATVRNHIHNILDKLAVHSKLEAVSLAFRKGWVAGIAEPLRPDGRGSSLT